VLSAAFTVAQAGLLPGRDPVAVTALLAAAGLTLAGTLAPSTLFAYGQARVSAEVAGAFVNLEPLVGAAAGAAAFGDPVGLAQAAGGAAILSGIALSSLPLLRPMHPGRVKTAPPLLQHAAGGGRGGREDGDGTTGHGAGFGQLAGPGTAAGEAAQPGGGVAGGARWVNRTPPPAPG
jgi:hypothetical protein